MASRTAAARPAELVSARICVVDAATGEHPHPGERADLASFQEQHLESPRHREHSFLRATITVAAGRAAGRGSAGLGCGHPVTLTFTGRRPHMPQSGMSLVEVTTSDRVATLTLNNPGERNTLTAPMVAEIIAAMDEIEADDGVGALVVTGAPPAFCAGANLGNLPSRARRASATSTKASCASPAARCRRSPRSTAPRSGRG